MEGFAHSAQWRIGPRRLVGDKAANRPDAPGKSMAQHPSDDLELLRQLAKGNEGAFEALYERYHGPIYRFVLHMSGSTAIAEEITQEVFLVLIGKPKSYDPARGTLAGYLFGIARNLMRRSLQQSSHDVPLPEEGTEDALEIADDNDFLEGLTQAESLDCLRKAVLALPEEYREAVVLCGLEEMTYPEAAAVLKCSPGTIASRLHRAKTILKMKLKTLGCVR